MNIPAVLWGLLAGGLIALSACLVDAAYAPFLAGGMLLFIMCITGPIFDFWDYGLNYFRRKRVSVWPSEASMDNVDRWNKTLMRTDDSSPTQHAA